MVNRQLVSNNSLKCLFTCLIDPVKYLYETIRQKVYLHGDR